MEILIPVIILCVIALVGGVVLVFFSAKFAVKEDETAEKIAEVLPGANCGGCGYSGCKAYAAAIANGEAPAHKCNPGGAEVIAKIREITGMRVMDITPKTAVVLCKGDNRVVETKMNYRGVQSCAAAAGYFAGTNACTHGCVGLGDCAKVCAYGAITVENDLARVDQSKCTG
ncbi:MAG: RnfABCDGE type electron transport complex subunit B, partial [Clostridia bacterium]|nr:RnfABCDGE type electron transport complex subunit B [Clostridia bacterium]